MGNLQFKNYPLIFAESCSTASFGPLLYNALKNGAIYYGATSPSINNSREFQNWKSCAFADGVKIGLVDLMDEVRTIGEIQMSINRELFENLSSSHQTIIQNSMKRSVHGLDISEPEIQTLLQFNLFGNPERPVVVGITLITTLR